MCQGCGTRVQNPAASADDRGLGGGVMGCAKRRLGHERAPRRKCPGHRVDGADLQRGGPVQRGHDRGQAFGEHGLACARRAKQGQVVATSRADLGGPAGGGLAEHLRQVGPGARSPGPAGRRPGRDLPAWPRRPAQGRFRRRPRRQPQRRPGGWPCAGPGDSPGGWPGASPGGWPGTAQATSSPLLAGSPRSQASNPARVGAPTTRSPGTSAASAAFAWATTTLAKPAPAAAAMAGRTPRTGRNRPSRPSSPKKATPSMAAPGMAPAAARIDNAMPKSKPLPRLGRLAGDRPTVTRRCGHRSWLLMIAARILSRASRSAVSGSPTSSRQGSPFAMSVSISTGYPSTPTRAIECVRATGT